MRHARYQAQGDQHTGRHDQRRRARQLASRLLRHGFGCGHARHDDGGSQRQKQCWNLRHQAVTNSQQRVDTSRITQGQAVHANTDGKTANDVDNKNQQTGNGVTAHELRGTVHGAEEFRFLRYLGAAFLGLLLIDQAGVQVGVDGHLLAGHGIQGETGNHLGHPTRALGHHDEVDDHQDAENDETDQVVAGNHELAERLNHLAGGVRALVAFHQHDPGRGHVQGQAQHGGQQQHRRKG